MAKYAGPTWLYSIAGSPPVEPVAVHGNRRRRVCGIAQRRHSREGSGLHAGQRPDAINQVVLKNLGACHVISRGHERHARF